MSAPDWREEARRIPVWPFVRTIARHKFEDGDGEWDPEWEPSFVVLATIESSGDVLAWFPDDPSQVFTTALSDDTCQHVIDLTDPDTLAAFDRRLAIRLGAPREATREGVAIHVGKGRLQVLAGVESRTTVTGAPFVGTDDPLLARVRAWNSVKP